MRASLFAAPFFVTTLAFAQMQPAAPAPATAPQPQSDPTRLDPDQKLLHVLNRFTYGPRPGDLERLRAIGLNAWFSQQLNPGAIDDSALEKRLADFPATRMPLDKLMELYPTNGMVRAAMNGNAARPGGTAAKAIYADQMERYKDRKNGKNPSDVASPADKVPLPQAPYAILALPPDPRFKALCRLTLPQLRELRRSLTPDQRDHLTDGMTPQQTEAIAAFSGPRGVVEAEDIQVKLLRDIYSERQLQEVMVDFWLNHFNVFIGKSEQAPYYIAAYERDAIRPNALGRFENLLAATATSPAMLNYLDNASSIGPRSDFARGVDARGRMLVRPPAPGRPVGLNENYARELMELHTVGVNGGYTQHDVTEVAKVFTGWTVGRRFREDPDARAEFDPTKHEPGDKSVMGQKIKSGGSNEGFAVLHLLASSPQCARFISTKLAVRFVSDDPPPAMVDRMSQAFLETHGDIRRVLLAMVNSPEFFSSTTYRAKVKTPQDYVVSAVRASGSNVQSTAALATAIADLGMPLYGHQTPDGYSMRADPWNNTAALVSRMNFALALASNRVAGVSTDFDKLLPHPTSKPSSPTQTTAIPSAPEQSNPTQRNPTQSSRTESAANSPNSESPASAPLDPAQKAAALESNLLHVPVSPRTQQLILAQTSSASASDLRKVSPVAGRRDPLALRTASRRPQDATTLDTQASVAAGLIIGSPEFQRR